MAHASVTVLTLCSVYIHLNTNKPFRTEQTAILINVLLLKSTLCAHPSVFLHPWFLVNLRVTCSFVRLVTPEFNVTYACIENIFCIEMYCQILMLFILYTVTK
jgi:hypothetical protein